MLRDMDDDDDDSNNKTTTTTTTTIIGTCGQKSLSSKKWRWLSNSFKDAVDLIFFKDVARVNQT